MPLTRISMEEFTLMEFREKSWSHRRENKFLTRNESCKHVDICSVVDTLPRKVCLVMPNEDVKANS